MKEELSIAELRKKRTLSTTDTPAADHNGTADGTATAVAEEEIWARATPRPSSRRLLPGELPPYAPGTDEDEGIPVPFDPYRLFDALKKNLGWCIFAGMLGAGLGVLWFFYGGKSNVSVHLARQEMPVLFRASSEDGESFQPPKYTDQALVNIIQSPEMVRHVAGKLNPPWSPERLAKSMIIFPERESELVTITFNGRAPVETAVDVVNLYAAEALERTRELQGNAAQSFKAFISEKLASVNKELEQVNLEMQSIPAAARAIDRDRQAEALLTQLADVETRYELARIDLEANNPINDRLQLAREELAELLLRYTEQHPFVLRQQEKIKLLESQAANPSGRSGRSIEDLRADNIHMVSSDTQRQSLAKQVEQLGALKESLQEKINGISQGDLGYALLKNRFQALRNISTALASRQREAELFLANPPGYFTILNPATPDRVNTRNHLKKSLVLTVFGALFGFFSVAGLVAVREVLDDRIRTIADLERATELPILGTLGDLEKMDAAAQKAWAFRTWTILKGKLTASQTQGIVCGFISAHHDEGRSTWIKLLTSSANERGLRVLTISTKPSEAGALHPHETPSDEETTNKQEALMKTFESNVLASPAQVAKHLRDPSNAFPVVHIPLPGWVWNLERRKQWQDALGQWQEIDKLVLLVELPPASEPESVLLAEKLPQLIWLSDSGKTTRKETRHHLETLRHAGCNLVGAVLNREPESFWRNQMSRWFGFIAAFVTLAAATSTQAQSPSREQAPPAQQKGTYLFSVSKEQRAPWQKNLTLGPGDILNLGFFGETNLTKTEVAIGPDGRISYLQATDIMAAGLTVDQLRERLDKELSKYYRAPRSIVTPVAYQSKKYFVLGKVMKRGVFTLDQPITVLEAIARAEGLESGMYNRNNIELADLSRSFLIRNGERIPIDFEKLFNEGDLSQNIAIQPNDYLYFPPANLKEVYVVGEVRTPGVVIHNSNTRLMGAIADRGGFNDKAYKAKVLVVRGSLNRPETFVINTHDIVDGRAPDFKLEPKDIVYVNYRPFIRAEELLDLAATGFIQSAVTTWTGQYIGPFIKSPIFHGIYNND